MEHQTRQSQGPELDESLMDEMRRVVRTAKLAVFVACLSLVVTIVVFFGLSRNMTGLAEALQEGEMHRLVLEERIDLLHQKLDGESSGGQ